MPPGPAGIVRLSTNSLGTSGMCTNTSASYIHVYILWAAQIKTERQTQSTHMNTDSTYSNGLTLLPSLAQQDGDLLVGI